MATSALRVEGPSLFPRFPDGLDAEPPALEVNASYHGVLIGTRLLHVGRRLDRSTRYLIGESAQADAPAPREVIGGAELPLVSPWSAGFLVNVTPQMTGDVAVAGKLYRLADYLEGRGSNFTLPPDGCARIQCGAMSFRIAHTTWEKPLPKRWFAWRWSDQKFTLATVLALGLLLLLCLAIPPDGAAVSDDLIAMSRTVGPFVVIPPAPEKVPEILAPKPSSEPATSRQALVGKPGRAGDRRAKETNGALVIKGNVKVDQVGKSRDDAKADIMNRGILGILGSAQNTAFASLMGRGLAAGEGKEDILANLVGSGLAGGYGAGGLGITGTGLGGGGPGLLTLGPGGFNTVGPRYVPRQGSVALGPHITRAPTIGDGIATVRGSLDKQIIRRVVHLHMNEVKYCYDQELVRKPALGGRLAVQFVVSPVGQVLTSVVQSSTLGNVRVEKCVTDAVKRWDFPKPQAGGIAIVSYPFNFVASSGG